MHWAADFTIATPAFPDNQRAVFKGHLFVGDVLLSDSGMKDHPLTPMTDANLVRVLQAQTARKVGLIEHAVVARGAEAVRARIAALRAEGVGLAVVDAISNDDLLRLGPALADLPLVTAGSGVAIGLPANFGLAPSAAGGRLATGDRVGGPWCRAVARWPRRARCVPSPQPAARRSRSTRWPWRPTRMPCSARWTGPCRSWRAARCWSIRRRIPPRYGQSRRNWAPTQPAR